MSLSPYIGSGDKQVGFADRDCLPSIKESSLARLAERLSPLGFEPVEAITGFRLDYRQADDEEFLVRRVALRHTLAHVAVANVVLDTNGA
jgi:hypothetical protein